MKPSAALATLDASIAAEYLTDAAIQTLAGRFDDPRERAAAVKLLDSHRFKKPGPKHSTLDDQVRALKRVRELRAQGVTKVELIDAIRREFPMLDQIGSVIAPNPSGRLVKRMKELFPD